MRTLGKFLWPCQGKKRSQMFWLLDESQLKGGGEEEISVIIV